MFAEYNNESPTEVYKSMAGGTAQINPMSDFLQENEKIMKSNVTVFNGQGFNLGSELPYIELVGPKDTTTSNLNLETVQYNSEARIEPFMSLCKPDESTSTCMKRVFECDPDRPWKECNTQLQSCKDDPIGSNICKYTPDGSTILKKFEAPKNQPKEVSVQYNRAG